MFFSLLGDWIRPNDIQLWNVDGFEDCPVPSIKGVIFDFSLFGSLPLPAYHHSFKGSFQMFARTLGTELKNIAPLFRWACVLGMDTWNKSESLSGN